jgi:gluconolactonase
MDRRNKAASAATVTPYGETGVPLGPTEPLPLGLLHGLQGGNPKVSFGAAGFSAFTGTIAVERIATGMRRAEGPVYFPAGR